MSVRRLASATTNHRWSTSRALLAPNDCPDEAVSGAAVAPLVSCRSAASATTANEKALGQWATRSAADNQGCARRRKNRRAARPEDRTGRAEE